MLESQCSFFPNRRTAFRLLDTNLCRFAVWIPDTPGDIAVQDHLITETKGRELAILFYLNDSGKSSDEDNSSRIAKPERKNGSGCQHQSGYVPPLCDRPAVKRGIRHCTHTRKVGRQRLALAALSGRY